MARLRGHRDLDLDAVLYVKSRPLGPFGGTIIDVDGVLPWRELGLDERRVRQLHEQRRIGHEKSGERNGAEQQQRPGAKVLRTAAVAPSAPPAKPSAQPPRSQRR